MIRSVALIDLPELAARFPCQDQARRDEVTLVANSMESFQKDVAPKSPPTPKKTPTKAALKTLPTTISLHRLP